jgi:hypothetical protein
MKQTKPTSGQLIIALLLMLTIPFMVGAHDKSKSKKSKKSEPVYITDRQPFQNRVLERGSDTVTVEFIDAVPVGVLLVMQHVSLSGTLSTGRWPAAVFAECSLFVVNELLLDEVILKLDVAMDRRVSDEYIVEGPITLYANTGDSVKAVCEGFDEIGPSTSITLLGTLVGEYVPVSDHRH